VLRRPRLGPGARWAIGSLALALVVAAEIGVVALVRDQDAAAWVGALDPIADGANALAFFAAAPALLGQRSAVSSR